MTIPIHEIETETPQAQNLIELEAEAVVRIHEARAKLGDSLVILGSRASLPA
jgi:hypothetical protein